MSTRINDLCDSIVTAIRDAWFPVSPDLVERVYEVDLDAATFLGRRVYVTPEAYANQGPANRREDTEDLTAVLLIAERHTLSGAASKEWLDERVKWVQDVVVGTLDRVRNQPAILGTPATGGGYWPQSREVEVYDRESLVERKLFLSVVSITFRHLYAP